MRAIVVYESLWGNTEQVARAIAHGVGPDASVTVVNAEAAPHDLSDMDLVIVGGPTHAFSMSRPSTRRGAFENNGAPTMPSRGIREWLAELTPVDHSIPAATFDTRVDSPRLPGSAAKAARQELRSLGFDVMAKAQTFRVHGYEGPLLDGELERATSWARELVIVRAGRGH